MASLDDIRNALRQVATEQTSSIKKLWMDFDTLDFLVRDKVVFQMVAPWNVNPIVMQLDKADVLDALAVETMDVATDCLARRLMDELPTSEGLDFEDARRCAHDYIGQLLDAVIVVGPELKF